MIRTENEYKEAVKRLENDRTVIQKQERELLKLNLKPEEIKRAMEPTLSFHEQLKEEVEWYERVKRGDFGILSSLRQIGRLLIALRISRGLTQKELAKMLSIPEPQVSRDERNEYHGVSVERAARILEAFRAHTETRVEIDSPPSRRRLAVAHS